MSIWGKNFTVDIFGESHGPYIGVVIGGVEPGFKPDMEKIQSFLDRRRPGGEEWSTARNEADRFEIVSGLSGGCATGAPLCALCKNSDKRSGDYPEGLNRPGHADYTAYMRYGGHNDARGGGRFSGRLTAPLVFAGALASQLLEKRGVYAAAHIRSIAGTEDSEFDRTEVTREQADSLKSRFPLLDGSKRAAMEKRIADAAKAGDSVGGVIECAVMGLPPGVGSEYFGSVESALSSMLFAVPAVKGVSFGAGFSFAEMRGSEANDGYVLRDGRITAAANNNGGILGGITNGMPVVFEAAIKPTPSISLPQRTVNLKTMEEETIEIKGRHDPCIVPRAVPVIEAAACIAFLDMMMGSDM